MFVRGTVLSFAGVCLTFTAVSAQNISLSVKSYAAPSAQHIRTADLNKDGFSDLVLFGDNFIAPNGAQYPGTPLAIMLNDGHGGFLPASVLEKSGYVTVAASIADLNGDGLPDIAACASQTGVNNQNYLNIYLNQGGGKFTLNQSIYAYQGCSTVAIGDANKDGKPDIALGTEDSGAGNEYDNVVTTYFNEGMGNFGNPYSQSVNLDGKRVEELCGLRDATGADFNGDGILDLVAIVDCYALNNVSNVFLLTGDGTGNYTPTLLFESNEDLSADEPYVSDVNGDGKPDVILVGQQPAQSSDTIGDLQFLINRGGGSFLNVNVAHLQTSSSAKPDHIYAGAAGNFNGDAYGDAAIAYERAGSSGLAVRFGTNNQGGYGPPVVLPPPTGTPLSLASADYNHAGTDGLAVLESSNGTNQIVVYLKKGGSDSLK